MIESKRQTLEQRRAQNAFDCSKGCNSKYKNLAKSLPALIMTSGLMPTLAFMESKREDDHYLKLAKDLRLWLRQRFANAKTDLGYGVLMKTLTEASPSDFQSFTRETMLWLKWLRQMADAASHEAERQ